MTYDPFAPGPYTVRQHTGQLVDRGRSDRPLPFDVWSPAEPARRPLLLYSHSSNGHRRQSTFLLRHLASHGYVVAAADHTGNTSADGASRAAAPALSPEQRDELVRRLIADRVPDLRFLLDATLAGDFAGRIDPPRVGLIGWSFGGWAVLAAPEADDRVGAVVALTPAGNARPLPGILPVTLTFAWRREVPTLLLAAELDDATPVPGVQELYERTPSAKRMFVLGNAGHGHFGDEIEPGPCPPEHAHLFTRGLALAHFDAALKQDPAAQRFLADDPIAALRQRGVAASAYPE